MKKKIKTILLVDDHEPTNIFNKLVIKSLDCAESVVVAEDGLQALEFLLKKVDGAYPVPELIFLDVNMPRMNGWEFLEGYQKIDTKQKGAVVIVMLTSSLNPDDQERANNIEDITGYAEKPLSRISLEKVIRKHFPECCD